MDRNVNYADIIITLLTNCVEISLWSKLWVLGDRATAYVADILLGAWICFPAVPLLIQLHANGLSKAVKDGLNVWAAAIHMGDPEEVRGSWLQPDPALAVEAIWIVKQ